MKWPTVLLGDLCEVTGGNAAPQGREHFENGTVPFVRMKDLGRFHFTDNLDCTDDRLTQETVISNRMTMFDPGCILFPRSGSVALNHRAILGLRGCVVSHIGVLQNISPKIKSKFLYRYLQAYDMTWLAKKTTGVDSIAFADVKRIPVPLPPLSEQKRIVCILDESEELRKLRAQADRRTADLIPALFHEMFGDPLGGKHKWPEVRFEEITRRITYGFTCPMKHLESGIPIITAKNVLEGQIDFQNVNYADIGEFAALTAKSKPERNDVLITKDGTIGRCAVVDVDFPLCINQSVALVQPKLDKVTPIFLSHYILFPSVNAFLNGMGKGQALKHLQITELAKMPIPLPPMALQKEFAVRVAEIRALETQQAASRHRLDDLFQSLLHRAFRGEL